MIWTFAPVVRELEKPLKPFEYEYAYEYEYDKGETACFMQQS